MKRFKNKVIVITGADTELGRATAIRVSEEGAKVVLIGKEHRILEAVSEELVKDHTWINSDNHLTITCDLSQNSHVTNMMDHIKQKFGSIDVLVLTHLLNTIIQNIDIDQQQLDSNANELNHHLNSYKNSILYLCRAVQPYMTDGSGAIINTALTFANSTNTRSGNHEEIEMSLLSLTEKLAKEYTAYNIRVNQVSSNVLENSYFNQDRGHVDQSLNSAPQTPLDKQISYKDIASTITFLASYDAAMITGLNLVVDGGTSIVNRQ